MVKAIRIKDFPDYYVTDMGDVYSRKICPTNRQGRIKKLKPGKTQKGYLNITLCRDGKTYTKRLHRVVAETFIPNPDNKPEINHINGIKTDNRVENLEFCTRSENEIHCYKVLKRKPNKPWLNRFGKDNCRSKIIQQIKDGKIIAEYYGAPEASKITGICKSSISATCRNKQNTSGEFQWRYKK